MKNKSPVIDIEAPFMYVCACCAMQQTLVYLLPNGRLPCAPVFLPISHA